MSKSDLFITVIIVALIIIYLLVLIAAFVSSKQTYLTSWLNVLTGVGILIYWIQQQVRIKQRVPEVREIAVLSFEVVTVAYAFYYIISRQWNSWFKIMQYMVFGIHLLALILFLVFMVTFKIKRLI